MKRSLEFAEIFHEKPDVVARAPGRVNLIGEHTDYNGGFVLPTAIPQETKVELRANSDSRQMRIVSANADSGTVITRLGEEAPRHEWYDYLLGATKILAAEGYAIRGFDARVSSDVPMGSGLSSSAALGIAFMRALREAFKLELDDVRMARLGQRIENEFVGARVGIMDPMACALAGQGEALFLDTRDLSFRRIALPRHAFEILVINSGVKHSHASGGYNERRAECEEACARLGVKELRDVTRGDLEAAKPKLSEKIFRRARHVVTENTRVLEAVRAIEAADAVRTGRLFNESHAAMRDDYQVSVPEVDTLVEIAQSLPEVFGARMTGGGFGGSIVVAAKPGSAARLGPEICERYEKETRQRPTLLVPSFAS